MAGYEPVYPLRFADDDTAQPFPTIYWLTDPDLDRRLANLERLGHIARLQQQLADDPALRAAIHADHAAYRDARWAMLTPEHRALVERSPSLLRTFRGGVAGTADFDHIKCLHAHYAHHLATDQPGTTLGRLITTLL
ncbi:MAG: DUF501 domain-containing protein [Planctomycetota bacterium]